MTKIALNTLFSTDPRILAFSDFIAALTTALESSAVGSK